MKSLFRKGLGCLTPADARAEQFCARVKFGDLIMLEAKRPRNLAHHQKFFAMLQVVKENQEHYKSVDDILDAFKFSIGHTRKIQTKRGIIEVPLSISFAALDQDQFNEFYDKAMDFMCAEVIPGLQKEDLRKELLTFAA